MSVCVPVTPVVNGGRSLDVTLHLTPSPQTHTPSCTSRVLLPVLQEAEPEQDSHGRPGCLQLVLHVAVAVRPVCAAHPGKPRDRFASLLCVL